MSRDPLYDLKRRGALLSQHSAMRCPPNCQRPGCQRQDLLVEVTLLDLWVLSQRLGKPVVDLFPDPVSLRLGPSPGWPFRKRMVLALKKPCPFLTETLCSVYEARPIPCALFPENISLDPGRLSAFGSEEDFAEYHCLKALPSVSEERRQILLALEKKVSAERFVTQLTLFGDSPFLIDFSQEAPSLSEPAEPGGKGPRVVRHQNLEALFQERLAKGSFSSLVRERMSAMDKDPEPCFALVREMEQNCGAFEVSRSFHRITPEGKIEKNV